MIDRVTHLVYEKFSDPTLVDWSNLMKEQVEPEAQTLATKLEPFISGSKNIFSEHSNVDMSNNFIVFNLKGIGSDAVLKSFAMLVIQDFMWNMIVEGKRNRPPGSIMMKFKFTLRMTIQQAISQTHGLEYGNMVLTHLVSHSYQ